jgi:hypothetical protein
MSVNSELNEKASFSPLVRLKRCALALSCKEFRGAQT